MCLVFPPRLRESWLPWLRYFWYPRKQQQQLSVVATAAWPRAAKTPAPAWPSLGSITHEVLRVLLVDPRVFFALLLTSRPYRRSWRKLKNGACQRRVGGLIFPARDILHKRPDFYFQAVGFDVWFVAKLPRRWILTRCEVLANRHRRTFNTSCLVGLV